jgi:hypothetical protein
MWIAIAIIVGVYLILYAAESLWSCVVVSPTNLHAEQLAVITELTEENAQLRNVAYPEVSPEEQRKRKLVAEKIKRLNLNAKRVLRYIMDHGIIRGTTLDLESGFEERDINSAVVEGTATGLLVSIGDSFTVKSQFNSALDFLLTSEGI